MAECYDTPRGLRSEPVARQELDPPSSSRPTLQTAPNTEDGLVPQIVSRVYHPLPLRRAAVGGRLRTLAGPILRKAALPARWQARHIYHEATVR